MNQRGFIPLWIAVVLGILAAGALMQSGKYDPEDRAKDRPEEYR